MNILFILYHGMTCNSAQHVISLAKGLHERGDSCVVAVPDAMVDAKQVGEAALTAAYALREISYCQLASKGAFFDDQAGPDVIVAWTPRENVRVAAEAALRRWNVPLVVHLEDNEDAITASYLGVALNKLQHLSFWQLRAIRGLALSHPRRMRALLARSRGISMVIDRLGEFCPKDLPKTVFWPGYDEDLFDLEAQTERDDPRAILRRNSVPDDATAIVYTGNIHRGNVEDMATLYDTVTTLNRQGLSVRLVRTGENHAAGFFERVVLSQPYVVELGVRPRAELPELLAGADVLVQPGMPGVFNDYRFPSKLPEFLVSGRPVVMARTNIGRELTDGTNARIVPNGTVAEFVEAIVQLRENPELARNLGKGGRDFARRHLRWHAAVESFRGLLEEVSQIPCTKKIRSHA